MLGPQTPFASRTHWLEQAEELAGVGFWRMDASTGKIDWSANMFRLFGFPIGTTPPVEEAMNRVHPDDRATAYADLSADFRSGGHQSISRVLLPSGVVRFIEGRTAAERDEHGKITALYGSVLDVTKQMETEQRLERARDVAERSTSRQTMFAANLSHEIRTPLTAIVGYAHLLGKQTDLPVRARRDADHIAQASTALLAIANNVLGQSRAAATLEATDYRPLAVGQIIDSVLALFTELAGAKRLELRHIVDATLPAHLEAHGDALTQILVNLVGNAVKFTDSGSVSVRTRYDAKTQTLSISVEDTGPGFDERTRDALFQRFSRGGDVHPLPSGAGLGLSICKGLVDALGGDITASSTPGQGSCFSVSLPARRSGAPDPAPEAEAGSIGVLLIDDHAANREIATRLLEALGARVACAADGASGLSLAMAEAFDLVLVDLRLPDMSGDVLASMIRSSPGPNSAARIVAFTASDIDPDSLPAAFDDLLGKPIDPQRLGGLVASTHLRVQAA